MNARRWEITDETDVDDGYGREYACEIYDEFERVVSLSAEDEKVTQCKENAHLIAAAPELLSALKIALARNEHSGACGAVGMKHCICWKRDARAAIQKAEGNNP